MAHKKEFISTGGGFSVLNDGVKTEVIAQDGTIKGEIKEALVEGSIYIGDSSGITSELSVKTNGGILIGNGTTAAVKTLSGDVTMTNAGEVTVADNAITSDKIDASVSKTLTVTLTASQIINLYTTPVEIIPAVTGKSIILDSFTFDLIGTATQFTGGGAVNLQYSDKAKGLGTTLHADIDASVITGATGEIITLRTPKDLSSIAIADIQGVGVYLGAKTADFANGTGTAKCIVKYHTI